MLPVETIFLCDKTHVFKSQASLFRGILQASFTILRILGFY